MKSGLPRCRRALAAGLVCIFLGSAIAQERPNRAAAKPESAPPVRAAVRVTQPAVPAAPAAPAARTTDRVAPTRARVEREAPVIPGSRTGGDSEQRRRLGAEKVAPAQVSPAWQLPRLAPAALGAAGAAANALPSPSTSPATSRLAEVLQPHGFVGNVAIDARAGLPHEILTDRARLNSVLTDLRAFNPPPGGWTVRQRRLPESNDKETADALDALRGAGTLDKLTAAESLVDDAARRGRQQQCVTAALEMDRHEANVRVIGGAAEPDAYQGSPAFWKAVERVNHKTAADYKRAAAAYATACLDSQWQSLTPAQRRGMLAVVGFVQLDGVAECMGTRIAPERFLTARHCLYQYDRDVGWQRGPVQRLQVSLAGRPDTWFDTEELDCDSPHPDTTCGRVQANNPLASDHLLLRLLPRAGAALPPMPAMRADRATARQMLVVPGRSSWITGRALATADPVYVTTADIGGCMISVNHEGCLVNSCQSEAGFSGAPMFARRKTDELVLVGIFLGSTSHNPYRQCQRPGRNFGADVPRPVAAALR